MFAKSCEEYATIVMVGRFWTFSSTLCIYVLVHVPFILVPEFSVVESKRNLQGILIQRKNHTNRNISNVKHPGKEKMNACATSSNCNPNCATNVECNPDCSTAGSAVGTTAQVDVPGVIEAGCNSIALQQTKPHVFTMTFSTPDAVSYVSLHNKGVRVTGRCSVLFRVRCTNDAHILLQLDKDDFKNNLYEIVLGSHGATKALMRDTPNGDPLTQTKIHNLLDPKHYRTFWISWANGDITVGMGERVGHKFIMAWHGMFFTEVNYIAISTGYGSSGTWQF